MLSHDSLLLNGLFPDCKWTIHLKLNCFAHIYLCSRRYYIQKCSFDKVSQWICMYLEGGVRRMTRTSETLILP